MMIMLLQRDCNEQIEKLVKIASLYQREMFTKIPGLRWKKRLEIGFDTEAWVPGKEPKGDSKREVWRKEIGEVMARKRLEAP
jgi:hypothetical protein